jgi:triosephosphate isomerase
MRKKISAGNWKMYKNSTEAKAYMNTLGGLLKDTPLENKQVIICAPSLFLEGMQNLNIDNIDLGAQNCYFENEGAFTGEISPKMLQEMSIKYVILGHSERREIFGESNEMLKQKVDATLVQGLCPIFCCGETLSERESGQLFDKIKIQLEDSLLHLDANQIINCIIAYEPIWAIGTGVTASPEQAEEMHAFIRKCIAEVYGNEVSEKIHILYGGSVKPNNAKELFGQPNIDGGLVGGASLKPEDFIQIISA